MKLFATDPIELPHGPFASGWALGVRRAVELLAATIANETVTADDVAKIRSMLDTELPPPDPSNRLLDLEKALEPLRSEIEERAFADEDWLNLAETMWGPHKEEEEEEVTVERRTEGA